MVAGMWYVLAGTLLAYGAIVVPFTIALLKAGRSDED